MLLTDDVCIFDGIRQFRPRAFLQARESSAVESSAVESPTSGLAAAVSAAAKSVTSQPVTPSANAKGRRLGM
eukprot:7162116-Prymnesium_polylepis.1